MAHNVCRQYVRFLVYIHVLKHWRVHSPKRLQSCSIALVRTGGMGCTHTRERNLSVCAGTTTWNNTGDIGPDAGVSVSEEPFYTSGVNALFTLVNGAYQPIISMDVSCLP